MAAGVHPAMAASVVLAGTWGSAISPGTSHNPFVADLAGVGLNTLVAIERGEGNPQLSTLLSILDTLGLQMNIKLKTLDYETV